MGHNAMTAGRKGGPLVDGYPSRGVSSPVFLPQSITGHLSSCQGLATVESSWFGFVPVAWAQGIYRNEWTRARLRGHPMVRGWRSERSSRVKLSLSRSWSRELKNDGMKRMKVSSKLGPEARERKRDEQKYDAARVLYVFVCPVICCIAQALPPPAAHSYLQGSLTPAAADHTA